MTRELSENEKKLIQILKSNADNPLTYKEMANEIDVRSTNTVAYYIKKLQKLGYLKVNPHNSRDYCILQKPDEEIAYLPVYALARCGHQGIQNDNAIIDKVAVSTDHLPHSSHEMILVEAKGDSMEPVIRDGDLVIVRRVGNNYADDGEIIMASAKGKGTFLKQVKINKSETVVYLVSLNREYSPLAIKPKDLTIHGIVKGTLFNYLKTK